MYAQRLKRVSPLVSVLLVLVGFTLVMVGSEPLRIAGAVLLGSAIFVPFLSLGIKPDPAPVNKDIDEAATRPGTEQEPPRT